MDLSSKITRKKGQSGIAKVVQCIQCGKMIPRDKAVEKRKSGLRLDYRLRTLLKKHGAYVSGRRSIVYYCVSCAKTPKIRVENEKILSPKARRGKNNKTKSKRLD